MIVDYAESFENGITLTRLGNTSLNTVCIVYKNDTFITAMVHAYDSYLDKENVSSVLNSRVVELYKNY